MKNHVDISGCSHRLTGVLPTNKGVHGLVDHVNTDRRANADLLALQKSTYDVDAVKIVIGFDVEQACDNFGTFDDARAGDGRNVRSSNGCRKPKVSSCSSRLNN